MTEWLVAWCYGGFGIAMLILISGGYCLFWTAGCSLSVLIGLHRCRCGIESCSSQLHQALWKRSACVPLFTIEGKRRAWN